MHSPAYAHYLLYLRINYGVRPSETENCPTIGPCQDDVTKRHTDTQPPTEAKVSQRVDE